MVVQLPKSGKAGSAYPQLYSKEPRIGDSLFAFLYLDLRACETELRLEIMATKSYPTPRPPPRLREGELTPLENTGFVTPNKAVIERVSKRLKFALLAMKWRRGNEVEL